MAKPTPAMIEEFDSIAGCAFADLERVTRRDPDCYLSGLKYVREEIDRKIKTEEELIGLDFISPEESNGNE